MIAIFFSYKHSCYSLLPQDLDVALAFAPIFTAFRLSEGLSLYAITDQPLNFIRICRTKTVQGAVLVLQAGIAVSKDCVILNTREEVRG